MLFDLQGKRRRLVQATYLTLAILMGGGLVLFGIGSDAQGGLLDGCGARDDANANPALQDRLDDAQARVVANPDDEEALGELVRTNYQLASDAASAGAGQLDTVRLQAASDAWDRYLDVNRRRPDDSLAGLMVQAYSEIGLNDPVRAAEAARIVAEERPSPQAFLALAQYSGLAGQTRQAELAGQRAVEVAPQSERETVQKQVDALDKQLKQLEAAQAAQAAQGAEGAQGIPGEAGGGGSPGGGAP